MYSVKLEWKSFNVDLASVEAWLKPQASDYVGNSADSALTLWFQTNDPSIVPMHDVTTSVPTLDDQGQPVLDGQGQPEMHDVTTSEPTGDPSLAQKIQTYWDAIQSNSAQATAYTQKAALAAVTVQVEAIAAFSTALLNQFAAENIAMGITADGKTEDVLDTMLPVMNALQGGAPTIAIKRAKAISPSSYDSKYVTAARLLSYVNKIEAFLGLSLSQSLS